MIKKWKATPVSQKHYIIGRSNDDNEFDGKPKSEEIRTRKPRRHTTGSGKQTIEDIQKAKEIVEMSNSSYKEAPENSLEGTNTLGRKQLISMLKQRYGPEIENYRNAREINEQEQVVTERNWDQRNDSIRNGSVLNQYTVKSKTFQSNKTQYQTNINNSSSMIRSTTNNASFRRSTRRSDSNDGSGGETSNSVSGNSDNDSGWSSHAIAFLQYRDEVKRVNLPSLMRSIDAVKSLFVEAFPNKVSLQHFQTGQKTIYIKDIENGVYFQLENIGDVSNRSFLKIHELDNQQAINNSIWDNLPPKKYSESSQDLEISSPKFKRESSSSSLRSDGILNRTNYISHNNFEFKGDTQKENSPQKNFRSSSFNNANDQYGKEMGPVFSQQFSPAVKRKPQVQTVPSSKVSVEDQLAGLAGLIDTALSDEEMRTAEAEECVNIKNPGKLSKNIINNLQNQTEQFNSRKEYLPKHYQPTVLVKAQETKADPTVSNATVIKKSGSVGSETSEEYKAATSIQRPQAKRDDKQNGSAFTNKTLNNITDISSDLLQQLNELEEEVKWRSEPERKLTAKENKSETFYSTQSIGSSNTLINKSSSSLQSSNTLFNLTNTTSTATTKAMNASTSSNTSPGSENASLFVYSSERKETLEHEDQEDELLESLSQPIYAQIDKAFLTSKAKLTPAPSAQTESAEENVQNSVQSPKLPKDRSTSGKLCKPPSVITPDFVELEDSAHIVKKRIYGLKKDLSEMRRVHLENTRQFKADIQKKLLLFRKKAAKAEELLQGKLDVNNSFIFAQEHPVRERRHRLTSDQIEYNKKRANTTEIIGKLEDRMEAIRLNVVTKKCVENPEELQAVHEELTSCAKSLSEVKNRYHGLIDMVEKVITSEKEVILEEEKFLKEEPENLEKLIIRCKALTDTLFTLQRLATVQNDATTKRREQKQHQQQQQQQQQLQQQQQQQQRQNKSYVYRTYADSGIM